MLPVPDPAVIFRTLPDGAVLLHTATEVYYGLNTVGARVWELLPPATLDLDELCAQLAAEYPDADPSDIRSDVLELLVELREAGLVTERARVLVDAAAAAPAA